MKVKNKIKLFKLKKKNSRQPISIIGPIQILSSLIIKTTIIKKMAKNEPSSTLSCMSALTINDFQKNNLNIYSHT